jgi:hypothetical protein
MSNNRSILPPIGRLMSLLKVFKTLDQKFSWSFLGFVLAIIFGSITVYSEFIKKNSPGISYELLSNANVLDVKETVGSLDILYKGNSLSHSGQSLKIMTLKVSNDGDQAILPNYYDPVDLIGFKVIGGSIVDGPRLLDASSSYLRDHLRVQYAQERVAFSPVILEPGEFFVIKVLVLHRNSDAPKLVPVGKVAGVRNISLTQQFQVDSKRSLLEITFGGSVWVQIVRTLVYFLGGLIFVVALFAVGAALSERLGKRKRRDVVRIFREYNALNLTEAAEVLFDIFVEEDFYGLKAAKGLVKNQDRLVAAYAAVNSEQDPEQLKKLASLPLNARRRAREDRSIYRRLVAANVIKEEEAGPQVDDRSRGLVDDFFSFVERKGFGSSHSLRSLHVDVELLGDDRASF